jgi:glucose/arabinose dehydrogenase
MRSTAMLLAVLCSAFTASAQDSKFKPPAPKAPTGSATAPLMTVPSNLVKGLNRPTAIALAFENRVFVAVTNGDKSDLVEIKNDKAVPFAAGLDPAVAMTSHYRWLFVVGKSSVWRVDKDGKTEIYSRPDQFKALKTELGDVCVDERETLYVTNRAASPTDSGSIYRVEGNGDKPGSRVSFVESRTAPVSPTAIAQDGTQFVIVATPIGKGTQLVRMRLGGGGPIAPITTVPSAVGGLTWDWFGRLFLTAPVGEGAGKLWGISRPGADPVLVGDGLRGPACVDPTGRKLLILDGPSGTLVELPAQIPGHEFDDAPLAIGTEHAFPNLQWENWQSETDAGKGNELRPLLVTHAGDGSNRIFVPLQQGYIHVFPNDPKATKTKLFLDLSKKVLWNDKENEQGLLGLAFHPRYKENGEFFVFYTLKDPKLTNVLSRFRVSKTDPDRVDPASEEEILRVQHRFWNHDGGTVAFGPDGFLYLCLGDGGSGGDPDKNGQNLGTLLAKILRIDVDKKEAGKNYGIPKDNPFVDVAGARPEIWAYGLRNPWRMAFDRKTGRLWTSDVGQNIYEEIDIITKGGNYGWSRREGLHPFGDEGVDVNPKMIDPIWEYHHEVGKSMTGGVVYRGKALPELEGMYVYGDYITGRIWALQYDDSKKRVVANRPLERTRDLIMSFGEDEAGEIYYLAGSYSNKGIYRFIRGENKR